MDIKTVRTMLQQLKYTFKKFLCSIYRTQKKSEPQMRFELMTLPVLDRML